MGSGLGPAGSTLAAARREITKMESLPLLVRLTIEKCVLMVRWMDDIWHVYPRVLPENVKRAVKDFSASDFYGSQLNLKKTAEDVSFGFKFDVSTGQILVEQNFTFQRTEIQAQVKKRWPLIQGPLAFAPDSSKQGILAGYFLRLLDYTNMNSDEVEKKMNRLCRELRSSGFSSPEILRAWKKTSRMATRSLPGIEDALSASAEFSEMSIIAEDFIAECKSASFAANREWSWAKAAAS